MGYPIQFGASPPPWGISSTLAHLNPPRGIPLSPDHPVTHLGIKASHPPANIPLPSSIPPTWKQPHVLGPCHTALALPAAPQRCPRTPCPCSPPCQHPRASLCGARGVPARGQDGVAVGAAYGRAEKGICGCSGGKTRAVASPKKGVWVREGRRHRAVTAGQGQQQAGGRGWRAHACPRARAAPGGGESRFSGGSASPARG